MTQEDFFNRYKYDTDTDLLGGGGFGRVYKAFDETRGRYVAIKVSEVKKGQESLALMREVELAASLPEHKNVAHYESCHRYKSPMGTYDYGILQYYSDGNLSQLIRNENLTSVQKEAIAKGIIAGIQHLHKNNIIHRDIKSANILIAKGYQGEYVPKIADFGLSKEFNDIEKSYFSNSFAGGSLLYVAPEQLEGKELRKNVDLWSLGVVLYELFTQNTPFKADVDDGSETARAEIIRKIRSAIIPADMSRIPQQWQEVIKVCLVVDPAKRVKSIEDVQESFSSMKQPNKGIDKTEVESGLGSESKVVASYGSKDEMEEIAKEKPISSWKIFILISLAFGYMLWWGLGDNLGGSSSQVNSEINNSPNKVEKSTPNQEEQVWNEALSKNIESAYARYLFLYPDGKYVKEAKKRIRGIDKESNLNKTKSSKINETMQNDDKKKETNNENEIRPFDNKTSIVACGSYLLKENAEKMKKKLNNLGYDFIVEKRLNSEYFMVRTKTLHTESRSKEIIEILKHAGYSCFDLFISNFKNERQIRQ